MGKKLRSDSFAARLTPRRRDELFESLAGGMSLQEAAELVGKWTKAEGCPATGSGRARKPSTQAISAWFAGARVERRFLAAKEAALVAQANCPDDFDAQARRALGQARFLAALEELSPGEIAKLERNELLRAKLELDRQKLEQDNRVARQALALDRARLLLARQKRGETGADLQEQIDLFLAEIERMKRGEEAE